MPSKASGLDFLNNKANLQQAKFQRLLDHVSSASARADENSRKQEELDREQDEIFKNSSELAGLGSSTKDIAEELKQKALSSDERLRKQLLGKNARARLPSSTAGKKHRRNGDVAIENDNNDEEAGRAASFKSKRAAPMEKSKDAQSGKSKKIKGEEKEEDRRTVASDDADQDSETEQVQQPASSKSKAPRSYLDEILEKKAKKRKKRKKNHDQQASAKSGS